MPKKTKAIPVDRAEWTFGDALYWHFFVYGTRPEGDPTAPTGRVWDPKLASHACDVSIRGFWNWIDDRNYPYGTDKIEDALFGAKPFHAARKELRELLEKVRIERAKPSKPETNGKLPAVVQGQAVAVYTTPFEADEVDGPLDEADLRALAPQSSENFGKTLWNPFRRISAGSPEPAERLARPSAARRAARRGIVAVIALAVVAGAYGVKRAIEDFTKRPQVAANLPPTAGPPKSDAPAISGQAKTEPGPTQRELPPQSVPPSPQAERAPTALPPPEPSPAPRAEPRVPTQSGPPLQQAPAPQASRPDEKPVELPKIEAPAPRAEPPPASLPTPAQTPLPSPATPAVVQPVPSAPIVGTNPAIAAAERERAKKEAEARELNTKLRAMQKGEANDLCARKLEGLSVPGFTLKCDTLIPFGRLLGAVSVSQTASSLGDCAARCERVPACVAFSFDAGAHAGAASCYLTGSIPAQNPATNWIAGIRQ